MASTSYSLSSKSDSSSFFFLRRCREGWFGCTFVLLFFSLVPLVEDGGVNKDWATELSGWFGGGVCVIELWGWLRERSWTTELLEWLEREGWPLEVWEGVEAGGRATEFWGWLGERQATEVWGWLGRGRAAELWEEDLATELLGLRGGGEWDTEFWGWLVQFCWRDFLGSCVCTVAWSVQSEMSKLFSFPCPSSTPASWNRTLLLTEESLLYALLRFLRMEGLGWGEETGDHCAGPSTWKGGTVLGLL